jgi:hypothetical protein
MRAAPAISEAQATFQAREEIHETPDLKFVPAMIGIANGILKGF